MVKVIGAGLPRTGTTSMKAALEVLGLGPCHHMMEVMADPGQVDHWLAAAAGPEVHWPTVLDGYASCQDWPSAFFWRELAEAYPDAKVILTVRDPGRWYTSFRTLLAQGPRGVDPETVPEPVRPVFAAMRRLRPALDRMRTDLFGVEFRSEADLPGADEAVAAYHRHVDAVRDTLPPDRLLVFDVRQGWEPLCAFLDVPPPETEPFPHLNDSDTMSRMFQQAIATGRIEFPFRPAGGRDG